MPSTSLLLPAKHCFFLILAFFRLLDFNDFLAVVEAAILADGVLQPHLAAVGAGHQWASREGVL